MKKAISPLIAAVLLIAFTMAVSAILISWITGFTKSETGLVGERGEKHIRCTYANIDAKKDDVKYDFSAGTLNVTVLNTGQENLYDFTFIVHTDKDIYYFNATNQRNETNPLKKGEAILFRTTSNNPPSTTETFEKLTIIAVCQKVYKITHEIDMTG